MQPRIRPLFRWLLPAAALLACPWPALADSPRFELTPFVGARVGGGFDLNNATAGTDESVDLGSGASFGIDLGLYRDSQSFYELLYSTQTAEVDSDSPAVDGVDLRVDYLQFGGTLCFPQENNHFVPYMSLTVGATLLKPDGDFDSETKLSGSLGGGFRFPLNDNVAVNLGVRGYLTLLESDTELFCVSDSTQAGCLVRSSGSTFFQAEGQLGLSVRF
ncbi:MAG: outer membrane beta-barrel protein [Steroidobacteraceae bacterium]